MARKGGNPEVMKKHLWKKGDPKAVEAAYKSHEARRKNISIFNAIRPYATIACREEDLTEPLVKFWEQRGIERENITAMMKDLSPMLLDALQDHDFDKYYKIMDMLGLTFNSTKEQNVKVAFASELNTNVNGELKISFEEVKPEPID